MTLNYQVQDNNHNEYDLFFSLSYTDTLDNSIYKPKKHKCMNEMSTAEISLKFVEKINRRLDNTELG